MNGHGVAETDALIAIATDTRSIRSFRLHGFGAPNMRPLVAREAATTNCFGGERRR